MVRPSQSLFSILICCSKTCQIRVFSISEAPEDALGKIKLLEEEEEVRRKQEAEDLQLYGKRLEPMDAVDTDEGTEFANSLPKRGIAEFGAGQFNPKISSSTQKKHKCKICAKRFTRPSSLQTHMYCHEGEKPFACGAEGSDRRFSVESNLLRHRKVHEGVNGPAKRRKLDESRDFDPAAVTSMDWNSGMTPIESWLNQSAVPSPVPIPSLDAEDSNQGSNPTIKELEEIKVFRNVHITRNEPQNDRNSAKIVDTTSDLEPRAQIYFRNIADRYPLLPLYLTRRLAIANCARAERLSQRRQEQEMSLDGPIHRVHWVDVPQSISQSRKDSSDNIGNGLGRDQGLDFHTYLPPVYSPATPQPDFWNGRRTSNRAASVHSRSSSRNSSLHGYEKVDPHDQNLASWDTGSRRSSASLFTAPAGLPPPPVELGRNLSFHCDICGEDIKVKRRREWQ